jgi:hypothetical protein
MIINDYPMHCCAVVQAYGMNIPAAELENTVRAATDAEYDRQLKTIEDHQKRHRRNCAMITLSDATQSRVAAAAVRAGWMKIQTFYNPNSGFNVSIWTKVLWPTREDYFKAIESQEYTAPKTPDWSRAANPYEALLIRDEEVEKIKQECAS